MPNTDFAMATGYGYGEIQIFLSITAMAKAGELGSKHNESTDQLLNGSTLNESSFNDHNHTSGEMIFFAAKNHKRILFLQLQIDH